MNELQEKLVTVYKQLKVKLYKEAASLQKFQLTQYFEKTRYLLLAFEVFTAIACFFITLEIINDEEIALETTRILKISLVYGLCLFSFLTLFKNYLTPAKLYKPKDYLNFAASHVLSFLIFIPLMRMLTQNYDVPFLAIFIGWILSFSASLSILVLSRVYHSHFVQFTADVKVKLDNLPHLPKKQSEEIQTKFLSTKGLSFFKGKTIAIVGACSDLFEEIFANLQRANIKKVILIDHHASALKNLTEKLGRTLPNLKIQAKVCDVNDQALYSHVIESEKPDVIFIKAPLYKNTDFENFLSFIRTNALALEFTSFLATTHNVANVILLNEYHPTQKENLPLITESFMRHAHDKNKTDFLIFHIENILGRSVIYSNEDTTLYVHTPNTIAELLLECVATVSGQATEFEYLLKPPLELAVKSFETYQQDHKESRESSWNTGKAAFLHLQNHFQDQVSDYLVRRQITFHINLILLDKILKAADECQEEELKDLVAEAFFSPMQRSA